MKDIVLVGHEYIDDGWYGDRHRYILSQSEGVGFTSFTAARKHAVKFKNYINERTKQTKLKATDLVVGERDTFVAFKYVSFGPSLSYTHHNVNVEDLK